MPTYHLRRSEKAISAEEDLLRIIASQKYMTLAMCKDGESYLVTLNYGFDPTERCFYFHCAGEGKKLDYLRANPKVWGQILEDVGYLPGKCDHAFRTVQFQGTVTFLDSLEEKRHALELMIDQLEPDPDSVKRRQINPKSLARVTIVRVAIEAWSGKQNVA